MVNFINKGDIFNLNGVHSYAHGCNCAGAMGKGIALQFRERYPKMYAEYKKLCQQGKFNPGDVFDYDYGEGHIYNLGTQKTWRTKAEVPYIRESLDKMLKLAQSAGVKSIALPTVGAGLGGLSWDLVKALIEDVASNYSMVDLFVVESYSPDFKR
ncbi:macro domain-containing protein [Parabacteroides distasonis]|uniref:Macro domain-containing protein n=1 Tax=Parabacteroides distasonis TaxID=823 RepID=A0AB35J9B1_PARDI|nr:macro domain-containing protein [Parabacteroides distasonis]MDB9005713.1 macro domain-containing protein [Parabacteroides distasonis]MDB9010118.1 macro domain-containing protein [Parabacteroides distasonis]MDB9022135.1 macro domain-containing protein [Parabacteroides distasonis]